MSRVRQILARFGGFSLIGAANTLLSMAVIFALNEWLGLDCRASYALAYAVTVALAYVANARLVFGARLSLPGFVGFFAAYLSGMLVGVALLWALCRLFPSWNETLLSYAVIPATMVWNFFFVNKLLARKGAAEAQGA